jgi:ribosomal protein S18 acetylase RimI-like enzyme
MTIRAATQLDLPALNEIAFAAKAHWGYSKEQLEIWNADIEITDELLHTTRIYLYEVNGHPVAFYQLDDRPIPWDLSALWVSPQHMGKGIGKALLTHASDSAASRGQSELSIDADPNAIGFYLASGCKIVGTVSAPIQDNPQRIRPQLVLSTGSA